VSFVITEKCLGERYANCVETCPVDCIYPGEFNEKVFMVIDPEICISCNACIGACPVDAIASNEKESPEYAKLNKALAPTFKGNPVVPIRPT
jgi:ferredoxin